MPLVPAMIIVEAFAKRLCMAGVPHNRLLADAFAARDGTGIKP
ncbi:hypothetical protein [Pseudomonas lijiangensis]|nr:MULTISPECIES: hypothetical protein [Pseudomonas syringae group]